jgi:hypothetical protein
MEDKIERERELAYLALFHCTDRGESVKIALIGIDGSCSTLYIKLLLMPNQSM